MIRWFPLLTLALFACDGGQEDSAKDSGGNVGLDTADTGDSADTAETADTGPIDEDGDTYSVEGGDCDDANPDIHPGADEVWYDGIDQNCDGNDGDQDGDGQAKSGFGGTDCNDDDATIFPGAQEICDGIDQDCDGAIDEEATAYWFADADGDGYGDGEVPLATCEGALGYVTNADDCDDERSDVNPAAEDVCDGKDNNCDGQTDEGIDTTPWYLDADEDGYGDPSAFIAACYQPAGYVESWMDCDDANAAVSPGAAEVCDGLDNDCDGSIDPDSAVDAGTWYTDGDADGYGDAASAVTTCTQPADTLATGGDCNDADAAVNPAAIEACNGQDDDCDGASDEAGSTGESTWYTDSDGDSFGDASTAVDACSGAADQVADGSDCDDADALVSPAASESCNGIDDDCDGGIDVGLTTTYYEDVDLDGYGDLSTALDACSASVGWVTDSTDCDDLDSAVNPAAAEVCDGVDDDCDGAVDEAGAFGEDDWYTDSDGDGFGDTATLVTQCDAPADGVLVDGDCNDASAATYPGALEACDGEDNDCDATTVETGTATWWDASGVATDVTATLAAGTVATPMVIGDASTADLTLKEGVLSLCDGTWYARVALSMAASELTIQGQGGAAATTITTASSSGGPTASVVSVTNATLTLQGLTITDGNGTSGSAGGGVVASRSLSYGALPTTPNVTLIDSVVSGNTTRYGGGIAVYGYAWVDLIDTVVSDNVGTSLGGGFWMQNYGELSCSASELGAAGFVGNTAPYGGGGYLSISTTGTVDAVGCDWGDDASGDDNSSYDLQQSPASTDHYCYGNATSLGDTVSCAAGSCTASTDATCP